MADAPEPGVYYGVPDAEYRAWPYVSQSVLSMFGDPEVCEDDIRDYIENPPEPSKYMQLGLDVERAVDGWDPMENVHILPEHIKQRRGKAWEDLQLSNPGVMFLPPSEYVERTDEADRILAMAAKITEDEDVAKLLTNAARQVSFVWDVELDLLEGQKATIRTKGRLDYLLLGTVNGERRARISDLKCMSKIGRFSIGSWALKHEWRVQSALYSDAIEALLGRRSQFYFIVCRTTGKPQVAIYNGHNSNDIPDHYRDQGRQAYRTYLEQYHECATTGVWHGYRGRDVEKHRIQDMWTPTWAE